MKRRKRRKQKKAIEKLFALRAYAISPDIGYTRLNHKWKNIQFLPFSLKTQRKERKKYKNNGYIIGRKKFGKK